MRWERIWGGVKTAPPIRLVEISDETAPCLKQKYSKNLRAMIIGV